MASFSFLHAADIHLDSPLTGLQRYEGVPAGEVRAAPRAAFDRLVETAIARGVDFVIIAGDLYDGDWKDIGTGLYFAAAMGRLHAASIPVYLLDGNHDAASLITRELPKLALPNVRRFSTRRAETHRIAHLGVAIHGRSFADRVVTENLAAEYPAAEPGMFNIGVLHTSLGGHAAHETYAPCTPEELAARGYAYWALGHVHEHAIVATRPYIVFPGNIQGRNIREDGPRGAVLVEVQDGEVSAVERLVLDVVRWARVTVDAAGLTDTDALHIRIADVLRGAVASLADGRPLVARVTLAGATTLHDSLQDVSGALRDDVRALAASVSSELWIEKLRVDTHAPRETAAPPDPVGPDMDDITGLIPSPDTELATLLQAEFGKFLAGVPQLAADEDSLVRQAARGQWAGIMQAASAALRHRLGDGLMRFSQLTLVSYGHFETCTLAFPRGEMDFHLVYGANEAGKSTTMSAMQDLLFGFPNAKAYHFRFDASLQRVGAVLDTQAGSLTVRRRRGTKGTLRDDADTPLDETAFASVLCGLSGEAFRQKFSRGPRQAACRRACHRGGQGRCGPGAVRRRVRRAGRAGSAGRAAG